MHNWHAAHKCARASHNMRPRLPMLCCCCCCCCNCRAWLWLTSIRASASAALRSTAGCALLTSQHAHCSTGKIKRSALAGNRIHNRLGNIARAGEVPLENCWPQDQANTTQHHLIHPCQFVTRLQANSGMVDATSMHMQSVSYLM